MSGGAAKGAGRMREQVEQRVSELKAELRKGQQMLTELEA